MRKILVIALILLSTSTFAKTKDYELQQMVNVLYDRLMLLFSYDKYRDFYENHIDAKEVDYENFEKYIKNAGVKIAGGYDNKLIGWEKKGKKIIITLELVYKNFADKRKRVQIFCKEEAGKISVPFKEFKKIYSVNSKRSNKK
jgi:hypothetical protein